jgi:DNA-binding IclR family transcriptional regulator
MPTGGSGRSPSISDEQLLEVFRRSEDPVLTASEVAEELPIKRRATYNYLRRLREDGVLRSKKVGGRASVWWLSGHVARCD